MFFYDIKNLLALIFEIRLRDSDVIKILDKSKIQLTKDKPLNLNEVIEVLNTIFGYDLNASELIFLTNRLALKNLDEEDLLRLRHNFIKIVSKTRNYIPTLKLNNSIFNKIVVGIEILFLEGRITENELLVRIKEIESFLLSQHA